jgi:YgiT-type zinc finger domain-containing protein
MKGDWDKCPLCGSQRIRKKTGEVSVQTASGAVEVPRIEYHECEGCREQFFDYEASRIVDEYCLRKVATPKR